MALSKEQKTGLGILGALAAIFGIRQLTKAAPPVICTPGDEKCIGPDWCRCNPAGTKWVVITPNATECAAPPLTAILYGTVTDADTGAPIEGIDVDCNGYTDTTAPDGTYRIENIPPGTYSVLFTDPSGRYEPREI